MADVDDLRYGVLDLYEKTILVLGQLLEIGPSVIALVQTLQEYDPRLVEIYVRELAAAKKQPAFQGMSVLLPVLEQAIQTLRVRGGQKGYER